MPKTEDTELKLPKTMGARADLLYKTRNARYEIQKKVDELKKLESAIEDSLIRELPKDEATGVAGKFAREKVVTEELPQVEDWTLLHAHIKKTGSFELLQKRLSVTAVADHWLNSKKALPGIGKFTKVKLSVTKV